MNTDYATKYPGYSRFEVVDEELMRRSNYDGWSILETYHVEALVEKEEVVGFIEKPTSERGYDIYDTQPREVKAKKIHKLKVVKFLIGENEGTAFIQQKYKLERALSEVSNRGFQIVGLEQKVETLQKNLNDSNASVVKYKKLVEESVEKLQGRDADMNMVVDENTKLKKELNKLTKHFGMAAVKEVLGGK